MNVSPFVNTAIQKSLNYCLQHGLNEITLAVLFYHMLDGSAENERGLRTLMALNVSREQMRFKLQNNIKARHGSARYKSPEDIPVGKDIQRITRDVIEASPDIIRDSKQIGVGELVLGCLRDDNNYIATVLAEFDITYDKFYRNYHEAKTRDISQAPAGAAAIVKDVIRAPALEEFGVNLNERALEGALDPVVGRDEEIRKALHILSRRRKNNPVLVGDAGVGKTAIAEGIAQRIVKGDVPRHLRDKVIFMLDITALTAGSKFRGDFEEKVRAILKECKRDPRIVIFIDELHTIVGTGGTEDALDLSNILKPALSRSEIRVIGATTEAEYERRIKKNPPLDRRFQPIRVVEPSEEAVRVILGNLLPRYAEHHGVKYAPTFVDDVIAISRFLSSNRSPDREIDLMDRTLALVRCKIEDVTVPPGKDLAKTEEAAQRIVESRRDKIVADRSFIVQAASEITQIPTRFIESGDDEQYLQDAEVFLRKRLVGQPEAITAALRVIRAIKTGTVDPNAPYGVLYADGPEGTGKSELAYLLAEILLGSRDKLYRVDMAEHDSGPWSATKIFGAPPGFVGFTDQDDNLPNHIARERFCVVLLDEIDSCDPRILDRFVAPFERGTIKNNHNQDVDITKTVFVLAGNVTSKLRRGTERGTMGFGAKAQQDEESFRREAMDRLKKRFSAKFLDRIEEVIFYRRLEKDALMDILNLAISHLNAKYSSIKFDLTDAAKQHVLQEAEQDSKEYAGARHIPRVLKRNVRDLLADAVLRKQSYILIDFSGDSFTVAEAKVTHAEQHSHS